MHGGGKKKENRGHMTVLFHNKGIEMIDLPKIVHYKSVTKAVPSFLNEVPPPVVGYKYTRTISSKIFNQKSVVKELDLDNGTKDMECSCSSSEFCYGPAGHVVTGDLRIIKDAKLRELVNKGPSYREQNNIDWCLNARICKEAVTKYKVKWSRRLGIDRRVLNEWEKKVHEAIDRRVQLLRSKHVNKRRKHVLQIKKHINYLHDFQRQFVLVPADKAANNVIVVCKKYYLDVVLNELSTTDTYVQDDRGSQCVILDHLQYMTKVNINVEPEHEDLPSFYWLPKLHKNPYGKRFIAASNRCTTKSLSKLLTTCLAKITCHFREYCNGIYNRTGVNCFWIVDNSQQVLNRIRKTNYFSPAKHFDSFDFSTLYTSIPHDSLKIALTSLVKEAYRVRGNKFLVVNKYGNACWSDTPSTASYKTSIREDSLIEMMEYLIDNIYIKVGNKVFRQEVGIPMGTDCAPLLANLFLFYYEYKYMKNLVKDNLQAAMKFNGTMRYIDDLLTLNNRGFASKIPDIYPPELDLKKTTESPSTVSYLDILITINNGQYVTAVYDKRDSFNFSIVNFPYLSSNIPSKPAYGVYISQLVRIGRICDNFEQFNDRHYKLTSKLIKQGFWYTRLCYFFKRFSRTHSEIFCKYKYDVSKHIQEGICLPVTVRVDLAKNITTRSR